MVSFHSNPKKGSAKECSNYHTIALISHTGKVILKILQARLQYELPDVQPGFKKGRGTRVKFPTSVGSLKKQESSRKTFTSALLTMPNPLCGSQQTGKFFRRWEYLLGNLYARQEATFRTVHGTRDWFPNGKEVRQGCILSPCIFNLYAEYIMRNAGLEEAQAVNQDCQEKYQ